MRLPWCAGATYGGSGTKDESVRPSRGPTLASAAPLPAAPACPAAPPPASGAPPLAPAMAALAPAAPAAPVHPMTLPCVGVAPSSGAARSQAPASNAALTKRNRARVIRVMVCLELREELPDGRGSETVLPIVPLPGRRAPHDGEARLAALVFLARRRRPGHRRAPAAIDAQDAVARREPAVVGVLRIHRVVNEEGGDVAATVGAGTDEDRQPSRDLRVRAHGPPSFAAEDDRHPGARAVSDREDPRLIDAVIRLGVFQRVVEEDHVRRVSDLVLVARALRLGRNDDRVLLRLVLDGDVRAGIAGPAAGVKREDRAVRLLFVVVGRQVRIEVAADARRRQRVLDELRRRLGRGLAAPGARLRRRRGPRAGAAAIPPRGASRAA